MMPRVKSIDKADLAKVQALEQQLGCCIVALEPQPQLAEISQDQLKQLQSLEKKMNAVLLAYKCQLQKTK